MKGNKALRGDGVRRRCCRDDKEEAGVRDLAEVRSNMLSDCQDVGGERQKSEPG